MKERPILFSAPMVRALLAGTKTQTRRIVKLPTKGEYHRPDMGGWAPSTVGGGGCFDRAGRPFAERACIWNQTTGTVVGCPYGVPGDRLWVKETWRPTESLQPWDLDVTYRADGEVRTIKDGEFGDRDWNMPKAAATGNVSPLFMPRWASRLTLEVAEVRVERLQDISEADALAEGSEACANGVWFDRSPKLAGSDAQGAYYCLWESINGAASWDANPWVWAVTFKRVTP